MNVLVRFPCVVSHYSPVFESLFSPAGYRYFRRYLSGILVSDNKTLDGINRLFVTERRNQSSFNRFVHRQNFDLAELNRRRLGLMQRNAATRFKQDSGCSGVLSLDDTLMSHYGHHFEHIYRIWDHVGERYTWGHHLVSLHYSDDETDYPVAHDLWEPPDWEAVAVRMRELGIHISEQKWTERHTEARKWRAYMRDRFGDYQHKRPELSEAHQTKVFRAVQLLRCFRRDHPDVELPVAMDSGYTNAETCRIIDAELHLAYVGSLAPQQALLLAGSEHITLQDFAERLRAQHQKGEARFYKTTVHHKKRALTYYAYCATHHVRGFKKQRLLIAHQKEDLSDAPCFSISNRTHWHASGMLRIRRHRWPIETFHQESKQEGLDKYQLRDFQAIKTHIAFVSTAYTMLKCAAHDPELLSMFRQRLQIEPNVTLPLLRRLLQLEGLMALVEFVQVQLSHGNSVEEVLRQLLHPVAY